MIESRLEEWCSILQWILKDMENLRQGAKLFWGLLMVQQLTKTFYIGVSFNLSSICLFTPFIAGDLHNKMSKCYITQIHKIIINVTTRLINSSLPFDLFLLVFLLLLTLIYTFQHGEHGPLAEGVVIEEHVTDVESGIF